MLHSAVWLSNVRNKNKFKNGHVAVFKLHQFSYQLRYAIFGGIILKRRDTHLIYDRPTTYSGACKK